MMGELILRNLLHRPLRTLIGAMGIAVEVALVVLIVGLTSGLLTETAKRIEGIGADIMLLPANSSVFFAFGSAPMPVKIGEKLAEMKYVQSVAPVLFQFNTSGVEIVYGIDPESFRAVSGGLVFIQGMTWKARTTFLWTTLRRKRKTYSPVKPTASSIMIGMLRESSSMERDLGSLSLALLCRNWWALGTKPAYSS